MGYWRSPYGRLNVGDSRRPKRRVVAVLIAHAMTCSDFRLTSHVSHNRTERALQLASQHVIAGAAVLVLPELRYPWTLWRKYPSDTHEPHTFLDRMSTLYNSSLYTRCLSALHIENVVHSRKTPSSLRAPPDCRGESVCVGIARKKA